MRTFLLTTLTALMGCCFLLGAANTASAQASLEFNQVIDLNFTSPIKTGNSNFYSDTTFVVPAGKVWKIASVSANAIDRPNTTSTSILYGQSNVFIDGEMVHNSLLTGGLHSARFGSPLWLPAGSHTLTLKHFSSSTSHTYRAYMRGVEFNVVP